MEIKERLESVSLEGEEWRHFEGRYWVSDQGRVFSEYKGLLKLSQIKGGYLGVTLTINGKTKRYPVHRLVATVFIPNPEDKPQVNHINGIKTDNRVVNLEWVTAKENVEHAIRTGLMSPNGAGKLLGKEDEIIAKFETGEYTQTELAEEYGVNKESIRYLLNSHDVKLPDRKDMVYLGDEKKGELIERFLTGEYKQKELAQIYNISNAQVCLILQTSDDPRVDEIIEHQKKHRGPYKLTKEEVEELNRRYDAGESTAKLAEDFGISTNSVRRNVKNPRKQKVTPIETLREIKRLYATGEFSYRALRKMFNVGAGVIRKALLLDD